LRDHLTRRYGNHKITNSRFAEERFLVPLGLDKYVPVDIEEIPSFDSMSIGCGGRRKSQKPNPWKHMFANVVAMSEQSERLKPGRGDVK
jgi:hypothetical protein